MTWRQVLSVALFFGGSGLALACEAVSHANDYETATSTLCGENALFCNGACVGQDSNNCGACGVTCAPTQVCSEGTCGSSCTGGTTLCGSSCVDVQNDPKNCGQCGGFPDAGVCTVCIEGQCASSCGNLTQCGTTCVDTMNDGENCGACGKGCKKDEVCAGGSCGLSCGSLTRCANSCVDTQTDTANCSGCGNRCNKPATGLAVCIAGFCRVTCPVGLTTCGTAGVPGSPGDQSCVAIATDNNNCGGCGIKCNPNLGTGQGTTICQNGLCVPASHP